MDITLQTKIEHPYIEKVEGSCGGKAKIKGTRIKVSQIAVEHIDMKMDIDEIVKSHPHLHYWEIYDALSYYYENQTEIDEELVEEMKFVKKMISKWREDYLQKISTTSVWSEEQVSLIENAGKELNKWQIPK